MKFTVTPEAKKVIGIFEDVTEKYKKRVDGASKAMAVATVVLVKDQIEGQKVVPPTSASWTAYKRRKGFDERTLVMTKEYLRSIREVQITEGVHGIIAHVDKARWAELGTALTPPRKHWSVAINEIDRLAPGIFEKNVLETLLR